ncbi:N-acetyltransferase family protein [Nocardioides sp. Bht2]|uniref:GNAT family N-acetyltransferase n=1 Tax=Nocardioides sp. Bht2 TaxID=3392297 RepID=UPI0039B4825D
MPQRIRAFQLEFFGQLPPVAQSCAFWESDPHDRAEPGQLDNRDVKLAWLTATLQEWGTCGQVAIVDDELIGFAFYAPSSRVPGGTAPLSGPTAGETVLLLGTWVDPRWRGGGVAKQLIQATAKDLIERRAAGAIEVIAAAHAAPPDRASTDPVHDVRLAQDAVHRDCRLPVAFAEAVGFEMQRAHPTYPRLRMNLRRTLPWSRGLAARWRRLVVAVRPPQMAPRPRRSEAAETRTVELSR